MRWFFDNIISLSVSFVESHNTKLRMAYNMSVTSLNIFEVVIAAVTEAIWAKWTFSFLADSNTFSSIETIPLKMCASF